MQSPPQVQDPCCILKPSHPSQESVLVSTFQARVMRSSGGEQRSLLPASAALLLAAVAAAVGLLLVAACDFVSECTGFESAGPLTYLDRSLAGRRTRRRLLELDASCRRLRHRRSLFTVSPGR